MPVLHVEYTCSDPNRWSNCVCVPPVTCVPAGTIDALLCCKQGTDNVMRMLLEVYRCVGREGVVSSVQQGALQRRWYGCC